MCVCDVMCEKRVTSVCMCVQSRASRVGSGRMCSVDSFIAALCLPGHSTSVMSGENELFQLQTIVHGETLTQTQTQSLLHARGETSDATQDPLLRWLLRSQRHIKDVVQIRATRQAIHRAHIEPMTAPTSPNMVSLRRIQAYTAGPSYVPSGVDAGLGGGGRHVNDRHRVEQHLGCRIHQLAALHIPAIDCARTSIPS